MLPLNQHPTVGAFSGYSNTILMRGDTDLYSKHYEFIKQRGNVKGYLKMSSAKELQSILTVRRHHVELYLALTRCITVNQMLSSCFSFAKRVASYLEPSRRNYLCAQWYLLNFLIKQHSTVQSKGFLQEKIETLFRNEKKDSSRKAIRICIYSRQSELN